MVLRPEALRERLLRLEEVVSRLEEMSRSVVSASFKDEWAAERGLQLGAEIILDIGNLILTAQFGVSAEDYEDILTQLERWGVIDESLRERLKGLGGFRNILVHDYLRLDFARVRNFLQRAPADFSEFGQAVSHWLAANEF